MSFTSNTSNRSKTALVWQPMATIKERMSRLFDNPLMADIVFKLRSNKQLMAHKVVVTSGSQLLHQVLNEGIDECNLEITFEDNRHYIHLNDCDINDLKPIVKYLYTDQLDMNEDNASNVIYWSNQLGVKIVVDKCLQTIELQLNDKNCLKWWQRLSSIKKTLNNERLIERCLQMISTYAFNVFKSQDIINLTNDQLIDLLSRNDLNINEIDLFNAAIRWAQQKCIRSGLTTRDHNLREMLGKAFDLIRFPLISSYDFGLIITRHSKLFTRSELVPLVSYINTGIPVEHDLPFTSSPRIPLLYSIAIPQECCCLSRCYPSPQMNYSQLMTNIPSPQRGCRLRSSPSPTQLMFLPLVKTTSITSMANCQQNGYKSSLQNKAVITDPNNPGQILSWEELIAKPTESEDEEYFDDNQSTSENDF